MASTKVKAFIIVAAGAAAGLYSTFRKRKTERTFLDNFVVGHVAALGAMMSTMGFLEAVDAEDGEMVFDKLALAYLGTQIVYQIDQVDSL